jgi:serine/threonine protein kinase
MIAALNWTLGPYRIAREIDRGQFGTVYEATDADGRRIALKLVPVQGADSEEKVAAERQGAALQQRFSRTYSHLVPEVLDHQRIDPYYAIAMELVSGEPLTSVIKAGRVPADRAATIALAICHFLEKAHEFTTNIDDQSETLIVHGDLKPAHILLLADGSIRVLDFGIAKALAARKAATTNKWGSVDYASPERLESGRVNEQVDFWSVGVILFEMLSGCRPYLHYEHNQSRLETAIRRQEPRVRVPLDVDPGLTAIVDKLLAPQIERRYQSATEIARDLHAFLNREPVAAVAEAARADQATLRIAPQAAVIPRSETTVATDPLPPLPVAVPPLPAAHSGESIAATEALPRAASLPPLPPPPPAPSVPSAPSDPSTPSDPSAPSTRSYRPGTAAVLSLLVPGIGQIYNRDYLRGIFWLIITPGFWIGSAGAFGWPFHLISSYTAYRRARRKTATVVASPSRSRPSFLRRRAPILMLLLLMVLGFEGVSLGRAQQLFEQVPSLEVSDIGAVRTAYRRVRRSPFGFGAALLSEPLKERFVDLADRTILEFRADTPALVRADWEHARDSLDLALEVAPSDTRVRAKRQYVLGRLAWMDANDRADVDRAIRLLRDSARLDPSSPDPYLALATIHAYSTRDLPGLTQAIDDAEIRGYKRGRRERAELGDVHKFLGDRARTEARQLSGPERVELLQRAAENYTQCVGQLDGLRLGASERALNDCRRRLATVSEEIDRHGAEQFETIVRLPF